MKEFSIGYDVPIDRPGEYGVHIWVERLGRTALTYGFRVCSAEGGVTYERGSRTVIRLDRTTRRPAEWSERAKSLGARLSRPER